MFCSLYLVQDSFTVVQDSFTDYLLCVLSDECVTGHNERITQDNIHTNVV